MYVVRMSFVVLLLALRIRVECKYKQVTAVHVDTVKTIPQVLQCVFPLS